MNFIKKHKKSLKLIYVTVISCLIFDALYSISQQITLQTIKSVLNLLNPLSLLFLLLLGCIAVIPMVVYDYVYTKKTAQNVKIPTLIKNSFIINTATNACGGGGFIGGSLRYFLFGKASKKLSNTAIVIAQIALFTTFGLVTNDALALSSNFKSLSIFPFSLKLTCLLFLLYVFVPFFVKNKQLQFKDYLQLIIGSSLEWMFALGFFIIVGLILGLHVNLLQVYLVVCFAGIIGAISFIPGGLGSFDSALVFGFHSIGISSSTAIAWSLIYRLGYYVIPFLIGLVLLGFTLIRRKSKKQ